MTQRVTSEAIAPIHLRARRLIAQWQQPLDRRGVPVREVCAAVHRAGVIRRMAFLAQPGRARLEERGVIRAMRGVAVGAVFGDGGVLPEEGAAPLRVAGI